VLLGGFAAQWFIADRMIVHSGEKEMITRLQHDGEALAEALSLDAAGSLQVDRQRLAPVFARPYSGHYYVVVHGGQRLASASFGEAPPFELPAPQRRRVDHLEGPRGQPLLVRTRLADVGGRQVQLAVAEDLSELQEDLAEFRLMFLAASLVVLAAALALQAREIRHALRPIERVRDAILQLPDGGGAPVAAVDAPDEIRPLLDEIDRLMAFVERRLAQSRTAIGNLSHALKTPLAGLFRLLDDPRLASHPDLQGALREQAEAIRTRLERELKRARLAGDRHAGSRFDPAAEMPVLADLLQRIHADKALALDWRAPPHPLAFDREDLLELIGNLADNACKWARGQVVIELRERDGLEIVVADDGPGCPPELLATLGARGVRADEGKPGHGLGLAIVRDVVDAAGGQLEFRASASLGGLEVTARLPRRPARTP
jgi:signal transduction histidine kinase